MKNQKGFTQLSILISVFVGLAVFGGSIYFAIQKGVFDRKVFDTSGITPVSNIINKEQKTVSNDLALVGWKTYTNTKWGYSIKYPPGWSVGEEKATIDSVNKIYSRVVLSSLDNNQHVSILLNQKEWTLKYEAHQTEKLIVAGTEHAAYLFPDGYECHMDSPDQKDCSFFVVPIYRDGVWYELRANGDAKTVTEFYQQIFSSFVFLPFDRNLPAKILKSLPPDFAIETRYGRLSDTQKVIIEFIVDDRSANEFSGDVLVEVREEGREEVLTTSRVPGRRVMEDPSHTKWFSVSFDKSKVVASNKDYPALDIRVNPRGEFGEINISNNTVHIPAYSI